jgi:hypothetical protein
MGKYCKYHWKILQAMGKYPKLMGLKLSFQFSLFHLHPIIINILVYLYI